MATLEEKQEAYGENYSEAEANPVLLQDTPQSEEGDLSLLREKGISGPINVNQ
jgi:hypothetical protein